MYHTIKYSDDEISLTDLVQGKKFKLNEVVLRKNLYVPIIRVRTTLKQQPLTKFMVDASKVWGTFIVVVRI